MARLASAREIGYQIRCDRSGAARSMSVDQNLAPICIPSPKKSVWAQLHVPPSQRQEIKLWFQRGGHTLDQLTKLNEKKERCEYVRNYYVNRCDAVWFLPPLLLLLSIVGLIVHHRARNPPPLPFV